MTARSIDESLAAIAAAEAQPEAKAAACRKHLERALRAWQAHAQRSLTAEGRAYALAKVADLRDRLGH